MLFSGVMRFSRFVDALQNAPSGDRTVGADVVRFGLRHLPEYGLADLHRCSVEIALHAVRAVVPGAALDCRDARARHPLENLARLLADVLDARVARDVVADVAEWLREVLLQQPIAVAQVQVLER